jgi:hypothetical protein
VSKSKRTRSTKRTKKGQQPPKRPLKVYEIDYNVIDLNAYIAAQCGKIEEHFRGLFGLRDDVEIISIEELTDEDFNYIMLAEVENDDNGGLYVSVVDNFSFNDIPNDNNE